MKRSLAALGSSLALAFALTTTGAAWADDPYTPEPTCPAESKHACKEADGYFFKKYYDTDYKKKHVVKYCLVPELTKEKCDFYDKKLVALVLTKTLWSFSKKDRECASDESKEVKACFLVKHIPHKKKEIKIPVKNELCEKCLEIEDEDPKDEAS
jgi:hypothetical protein